MSYDGLANPSPNPTIKEVAHNLKKQLLIPSI
jgi:hypothetical protein